MSLRNLDALFQPRSIALIGPGRNPGTVGNVLARNLLSAGFEGPIMPVHPEIKAINGVLCYPDIDQLPLVPDLAVIATPAAVVPDIVARLGARGTRAAVVISSGFAEAGREGAALQQQLLDAAQPHILRICGPDCVGIAVPSIGLNASFSHVMPLKGDLAFVSQSGAVMAAALDWSVNRKIGFSHLVCMGNMADVDIGDMLDWLAADTRTRAILLYVEAITNARKFMSAARAAARIKPVIVVKAGRSPAAARAITSHTGTMAGEDAVYDAAFRRAGMLRVATLDQLFAAVETLGRGFSTKGDRLAILTNGGGLGVLATDALIEQGGTLAELSAETIAKLDAVLPASWSGCNPVDILGTADGARYRAALEILLAERNVDAILVMNGPTAIADSVEAADALVGALAGRKRPVLANWLGEGAAVEARRRFAAARVPSYAVPEDAISAFMQLVNYRRNQAELMQLPSQGAATERAADTARAREVIDLAGKREWLTEAEAKDLVAAYGIPVVRTCTAPSPEAAAEAAATLQPPYVLKIVSPQITHKSDVGGVALELADPAAVEAAARTMIERVHAVQPDAEIAGFSVQEMVRKPGGLELIMGARDDAVFGPVIAFGAGGTAVEVHDDMELALAPLTADLARATMARTRIWKIMNGHRGTPAVDIDAATKALVRLGQLMADLPEVAELDINPVLIDADGLVALDARVRLAPPRLPGHGRLAIRPYPASLEQWVSARDGSRYFFRPIRPDDAAAMQAMIERSDVEDLRLRFFSAMRRLPPQMAARLTQIDYAREMALVALPAEDSDEMLGVVRLAADPDLNRAEFGILVRSDLIGRGLGYRLMESIISYGRSRGIGEIYGEILAENTRMLTLCRSFGFTSHSVPSDPGIVEMRLTLK